MTKAEMIAELVIDKHSGFKDGDEPMLESCSDARLEEFRAATRARAAEQDAKTKLENDHRNVGARLKVAEDRLRTAEEAAGKEIDEEEFLSRAPQSIRSLVESHRAAETAEKTSIIAQLKDCGAETEEELNKKTLDQLRTLAAYARINVPDFSGRALPRDPNSRQKSTQSFAPPNPYEAGLKALREKGN